MGRSREWTTSPAHPLVLVCPQRGMLLLCQLVKILSWAEKNPWRVSGMTVVCVKKRLPLAHLMRWLTLFTSELSKEGCPLTLNDTIACNNCRYNLVGSHSRLIWGMLLVFCCTCRITGARSTCDC